MAQLFLDSSGSWLNALVVNDRGRVFWRGQKRRPGQREIMFPLLESLLEQAGMTPDILEVIGVVTGPGSFTGLRTGLAGVLAMARGSGARVVGAGSFEAARGLLPEKNWSRIHICLPALRGEVLWTCFTTAGVIQPPVMLPEEAVSAGPAWEVGEDELFFGEALPAKRWAGLRGGQYRPGVQALSPGLYELFQKGDLKPLEELKPTYHRPSDAEADQGVPNTYPGQTEFKLSAD